MYQKKGALSITVLLPLFLCAYLLCCTVNLFAYDITGIDSLQKELSEIKDATAEVDILSEIADNYLAVNRYHDALEYYIKALAKNKSKDRSIELLGNSGNVYVQVGDYINALNNYQAAYNILYEDMTTSVNASSEDTLTLMGLKYQIANVYKSISDYERAILNYNEVTALNRNNQDITSTWFTILVGMGMGDCYLDRGNYTQALKHYSEVESVLSREEEQWIPKEHFVQVLNRIGVAYVEKGTLDSAYYYANKALLLAETPPAIKEEMPNIYLTIGKVYLQKKEYQSSEKYLKKSIDLSQQLGKLNNESEAWKSVSQVYDKWGRPTDALDAFQKHIVLRDSIYGIQKLQEMTRIDMQSRFDRMNYSDSIARYEEKEMIDYEMQKQRMLTYSGFGGLVLILLLSFFIYRNYNHEKKANKLINEEKQKSETLLLNILPDEIAEELKKEGKAEARLYDHVTVLFTDFVNFTSVGERLSPKELVEELDFCFKAFDQIVDKYDIEKIKTIGDAYLAVSGLPAPNAKHAIDITKAAIEIRDFVSARKKELKDRTFDIRIGIHSGSVIAGIVGVKKFAYDIWGDTVNIAARMESSGESGRINISENTHHLIEDNFKCIYRGEIAAKNKGLLRMYFVENALSV